MISIKCLFETGAGPILKSTDLLDCGRPNSNHCCDTQEFCGAFDAKLTMSGTIILLLMLCESNTRVTIGVVYMLAVLVLLAGPTLNTLLNQSTWPREGSSVTTSRR